jgi:hypothetical protein
VSRSRYCILLVDFYPSAAKVGGGAGIVRSEAASLPTVASVMRVRAETVDDPAPVVRNLKFRTLLVGDKGKDSNQVVVLEQREEIVR